jgi:hypothetical protein
MFIKMKNLKMAFGLFVLLVFALVVFVATVTSAQNTMETDKKTRTLTGCLTKGNDAKEFHLTAKDGGKWDLKSDTVKLAEHVGHMVTVGGVVENPVPHEMKEDVKTAVNKDAKETGDLTVTDLTMVSASCK